MIEWREVICEQKAAAGGQLHKTVPEIVCAHVGAIGAERAIAGLEINVAVGIRGGRCSALPNTAQSTVRCGVKYTNLLQRLPIVTDNPAVIGPVVSM